MLFKAFGSWQNNSNVVSVKLARLVSLLNKYLETFVGGILWLVLLVLCVSYNYSESVCHSAMLDLNIKHFSSG